MIHQPGKIAGFQASGMTSMRTYLNHGLVATAPGVAIMLTTAGAVFAPIGAALAQQVRAARSRLRVQPRR